MWTTNLEKGGYFEIVDADRTTNLEGGGYEEKIIVDAQLASTVSDTPLCPITWVAY